MLLHNMLRKCDAVFASCCCCSETKMDTAERLVQKELAVFDKLGRLEVFLQLQKVQHNFQQHMPQKQTGPVLIFDMLKHI